MRKLRDDESAAAPVTAAPWIPLRNQTWLAPVLGSCQTTSTRPSRLKSRPAFWFPLFCEMLILCPAMVRIADRAPPLFPAMATETDPFPRPVGFPTVSQSTADPALQAQVSGAVTVMETDD